MLREWPTGPQGTTEKRWSKRGKLAIGRAVLSGRRTVGVSQRTFGIRAGVSQPVISRLETGRLNGIRWQTLARIVGPLEATGAFRIREISGGPPRA